MNNKEIEELKDDTIMSLNMFKDARRPTHETTKVIEMAVIKLTEEAQNARGRLAQLQDAVHDFAQTLDRSADLGEGQGYLECLEEVLKSQKS